MQPRAFHPHPDEQEFREIAASIPSFAGYWLEAESGVLVVGVTNEADAQGAIALAVSRSSAQRSAAQARGLPGGVRATKVRYRFAELSDWRDAISFTLLGREQGVVLVDLDERHNQITVGIDASLRADARQLVSARARASGIPMNAINVVAATPMPRSQYGSLLTSITRPLLAGTQVTAGSGGACSMGPIVRLDNIVYALTNSHCAEPAGVTGLTMYQPSNTGDPAYNVGTEYWDRPPYTVSWGGYTTNNSRWSDAAMFSINSGFGAALGRVARTTGDQSITIDQSNPFFPITGQEQGGIAQGWFVYKMGRTTGWTYGNVTQSCVDVVAEGSNIRYRCQFRTNYLTMVGDSGGPVFAPYAGSFIIVGIHWGGGPGIGGTFSGFRGIEMDLLNSFDTGRFFAY